MGCSWLFIRAPNRFFSKLRLLQRRNERFHRPLSAAEVWNLEPHPRGLTPYISDNSMKCSVHRNLTLRGPWGSIWTPANLFQTKASHPRQNNSFTSAYYPHLICSFFIAFSASFLSLFISRTLLRRLSYISLCIFLLSKYWYWVIIHKMSSCEGETPISSTHRYLF